MKKSRTVWVFEVSTGGETVFWADADADAQSISDVKGGDKANTLSESAHDERDLGGEWGSPLGRRRGPAPSTGTQSMLYNPFDKSQQSQPSNFRR